jgi:hypothetical protein
LNKSVLKGHDFSRAADGATFSAALAAEGCFGSFKTFPQGLKPKAFEASLRHD